MHKVFRRVLKYAARILQTMGRQTRGSVAVRIYYTGIGSIPTDPYISEHRFRAIMELEKNGLNETCPYDPNTCDLLELVGWAGAEMFVPQNE
jgi:hypothetical protein